MDMEGALKKYVAMGAHEIIYRELFLQNPDIYFYSQKGKFYADWSEFISYYAATAPHHTVLPQNAPTLFEHEITEPDFFDDSAKDIEIVFNSRYCPPFWHSLGFIKIMYVLNGEFEINLSMNKTIRLPKGSFIIVPPNIMQSVFSWHDEDVVINVFLKLSTFEKAFSSVLMKESNTSSWFWQILYGKTESNIITYQGEEVPFLSSLIVSVIEERQKNQPGSELLLIGQVITFLGYAMAYLRENLFLLSDTRLGNAVLPEIMQYIHENYSTITLPVLAEHFQRTESYMSRFIKAETGSTFIQILKQYRLYKAASMLLETDMSIEAIMLNVGYGDISYFYRAFKKLYGKTPKKYRETHRTNR